LTAQELPLTECLKDTVNRFLPLLARDHRAGRARGQRVLIAAHGNSLRALVKYLDDVPEEGHRGAEYPHRDAAGV
jgi:2,3-bisphosphoglycerate-dependent phosphoglycerate mutase